jgi:hypothetical protein
MSLIEICLPAVSWERARRQPVGGNIRRFTYADGCRRDEVDQLDTTG